MLQLSSWWLLLAAFLSLTTANDSFQPCPLLGPRFPIPTALTTSQTMNMALRNLTEAFDEMISSGDSSFGEISPNTTSFSVALFSTHGSGNASEPFIYQYHHTAPSLAANSNGVTEVGSSSIYNIGGLTQMLTVYTFLICVGDVHWQRPITNFLPELVSSTPSQPSKSIQWEDVRLIDLASHMAGIPRDGR